MKSLAELINTEEPGWDLVRSWIDEATNHVEVLPCTKEAGDRALLNTQVTTRSPMGAIVHQTGGLLIDRGWIRILGAGCDRLPLSQPDWNLGRSVLQFGDQASFWLVGWDVLGGQFAINGGGIGTNPGKLYYFAIDTLEWEEMEFGFSDFIWWCLTGDLEKFYGGFRWAGWQDEVASLAGDQVIGFYPFLSAQAESIDDRHRKPVPVTEVFELFIGSTLS